MDRTVIIMVLLAANFVIIAVATFALIRRGPRRDERDVAHVGMPAHVQMASAPGSSTSDPMLGLRLGTASADTLAELDSIGPSTRGALIGTMSAVADSEPSLPSTAQEQNVLTPDEDAKARMMDSAIGHGASKTWDPVGVESLDGALIDPDTGFATRRAWDEVFRNEDNRHARYHRAVTVAVFELDGLETLAVRLGKGPAERLIGPVAATMRANARVADILARLGHTRFVALLPETDEIAAINYVERVRAACDLWLAAGAVAVRLAIGWAKPPEGGGLGEALRLADERLNSDRRRQGGLAWPVVDAQPDLTREPTLTPSTRSAASAGSPAGATASARSEHLQDILADFLEHPDPIGSTSDHGANSDDTDT